VGDVITNVERLEGGWWRGRLRGEVGMFPDNFVKVGDVWVALLSFTSGKAAFGDSKVVKIRLLVVV